MKVPYFRLKFSSSERKEVLDALKTGWVTTGPKTARFEKEIIRLTGARYAAAVSSATAGLHLVMESLRPKAGEQVITTPFTMAATIEAILYSGANPILVDIDPVTLNIDPAAVEKKINKKTRAIAAVDIAGYPCRYDFLGSLAKTHKLFLLDDAAHALWAEFHGRPIGSLADATVFSFYSTKNITTGEGGMVVSNSNRLIEKVRHLSLHGMTSSGYKRYRGGSWKYDIITLGYKYNLPDLAAALGLGQLVNFEKNQARRTRLAERYRANLKNSAEFIELPPEGHNIRQAWHLFIIKLNLKRWKINRDKLIMELEKRGVGCGVHFIPVYRFSYFKKALPFRAKDFPECDKVFKRVISLPLYPDLSLKEVDYVCEVLTDLAAKFAR
nr:DegT/DnrJ/EryC1/StrS aminotransferase family protein [candidate division Zixibacteria bacterium]